LGVLGIAIKCRIYKGEQTMNVGRRIISSISVSLVLAGGAAAPISVLAQGVPTSYKASPEVYKLIAENDQFRVIQATWKPGQRDAWHSHAGALASYLLTDCKSRVHTPDGKYQERSRKAGEANFSPVIASHAVENVGTTECRLVIVERK
jgi:quercetin dioxygenase-like cupin family protein